MVGDYVTPTPNMTDLPQADKRQVRTLLGRFWTVANVISLIRLLLTIPITYLILVDENLPLLFALLAVAIISDFFDGRVARWSRTVSEWGKVLDPLADKVAAIAVTLALVIRGSLPVWFVLLVAGRDIFIVLGGVLLARKHGVVVMSMWIGKIAVTAVAITALAALLKADPPIMNFSIWATTVLLAASFVAYATRFIRLIRMDPAARSLGEMHSITPAT